MPSEDIAFAEMTCFGEDIAGSEDGNDLDNAVAAVYGEQRVVIDGVGAEYGVTIIDFATDTLGEDKLLRI